MITKILESIAIGFMVMLMVCIPFSNSLSVKKSEAFLGDSVSGSALFTKEYILDFILYGLINRTVENLVSQTTNWVNSGFEGNPLYVSDLRSFMLDVGDGVVGDLLVKEGLGFLCSPFTADISALVQIRYNKNSRNLPRQPQCTLTGALSNIENFVEGDFISGGGWKTWGKVTVDPYSNPYSSIFEVESLLSARLADAKTEKNDVLNRSNNFLNKEDCTTDAAGKETCVSVTPGSVIEKQLNEAVGMPGMRLTVADEMNELLSALFGALINQVVGDAGGDNGGLAGVSTNGYFTNVEKASNTALASNMLTAEYSYMQNEQSVIETIQQAKIACALRGDRLSNSLTNTLNGAQSNVETSEDNIHILEQINIDIEKNENEVSNSNWLTQHNINMTTRKVTNITLVKTEISSPGSCI